MRWPHIARGRASREGTALEERCCERSELLGAIGSDCEPRGESGSDREAVALCALFTGLLRRARVLLLVKLTRKWRAVTTVVTTIPGCVSSHRIDRLSFGENPFLDR